MGIVCSEEKKVWQSYREMSAAKNKKIFIIDSDLACTPTPVTFVRTLEEVIKLMNQK
jgi:iron complex transport system substrate-binding protein